MTDGVTGGDGRHRAHHAAGGHSGGASGEDFGGAIGRDPSGESAGDADFEPYAALAAIERATAELLASAAALGDADVRAPSLLPGWTRGHVLTHLARNADGGTRLLRWARTGVEEREYESPAARAAEIEAGAGRPAAALLADVRAAANRFAHEYRLMPAGAWARIVRWTAGQERPASRAADARLTEVLVHHVDLDAGYTPADWPGDFATAQLARVAAAFAAREAGTVPAMRLTAVDTGASYEIGAPDANRGSDGSGGSYGTGTGIGADADTSDVVPRISGTGRALLAWLMGRSAGAPRLVVAGGGPLPEPPFLY